MGFMCALLLFHHRWVDAGLIRSEGDECFSPLKARRLLQGSQCQSWSIPSHPDPSSTSAQFGSPGQDSNCSPGMVDKSLWLANAPGSWSRASGQSGMEQISEATACGHSSWRFAGISSAAAGGGWGQGAGSWLSGTVRANVTGSDTVQHGSKELTVYHVEVADDSGKWQVTRR